MCSPKLCSPIPPSIVTSRLPLARAPNSRRSLFGSPARFHQERCHGGPNGRAPRSGVLWRRWCGEVVASGGMAVHRWWTGGDEDLAGTRAKWDLDLKNFWLNWDREWLYGPEMTRIWWYCFLFIWEKHEKSVWFCSAWCCVMIYCLPSRYAGVSVVDSHLQFSFF